VTEPLSARSPHRFRRRLTAAFVLVAVLSAGVLAVVTVILVREYRWRSFRNQAESEARLVLALAPRELTEASFERLVEAYGGRAGADTVAIVGGEVFASASQIGVDDIPSPLREPPPEGFAVDGTDVEGADFHVVAARVSGTRYYFFFSLEQLQDSFRELQLVLAAGWFLTVSLAAAVGHAVARRTLQPGRAAAGAASDLAAGLLDTRIDVTSDDEFGAWADSFNRMAEALAETIGRLEEAAARERRFTADVAHDLRTPLTGVSAAAGFLEEDLERLPVDLQRAARVLVADVRRLRLLVAELLELARIDSGSEEIRRERTRLAQAVAAVVNGVAEAHGRALDVRLDIAEELEIVADRARLRRVLSNLLDNAVEHGSEPIVVQAKADDERVVVEVRDSGPGIDPASLPHVFDRFYKADSARTGQGTGLGLAIARAQAEIQGGTLTAANAEHGGARFEVTLPQSE
jgi:signal transduction histidine kinase